jgi:hypothetical protein
MGQITRTKFGIVKLTNFTHDQILNLPTTQTEVVNEILSAPNQSNNIILPVIIVLHLDPWFADYTNIDAMSKIGFDVPGGVWISQGLSFPSNLILAAGQSSYSAIGLSIAAQNATSAFQGALSMITSNGVLGNFQGGDPRNVLRIKIFYLAS